jgi:glyoxylate/hydroxypyruvate reductase A
MVDPAMNTAMAETALWATLALHRGFFAYARQQRRAVAAAPAAPRRRGAGAGAGPGPDGPRGGAALAQQGYPVAWRRAAGGAAIRRGRITGRRPLVAALPAPRC